MTTFFHLDAAVYVYPRDHEWSKAQLDEVVAAAQCVPSLSGAVADGNWQRGLNFPANDEHRAWTAKEFPQNNVVGLGGDVRTNHYRYYFRTLHVDCVEFLPKWGVSLQQLVDLTRVITNLGHTVLAVHGFDFANEKPADNLRKRVINSAEHARRLGLRVQKYGNYGTCFRGLELVEVESFKKQPGPHYRW